MPSGTFKVFAAAAVFLMLVIWTFDMGRGKLQFSNTVRSTDGHLQVWNVDAFEAVLTTPEWKQGVVD